MRGRHLDKSSHILDQMFQCIVVNAFWLTASVVPSENYPHHNYPHHEMIMITTTMIITTCCQRRQLCTVVESV